MLCYILYRYIWIYQGHGLRTPDWRLLRHSTQTWVPRRCWRQWSWRDWITVLKGKNGKPKKSWFQNAWQLHIFLYFFCLLGLDGWEKGGWQFFWFLMTNFGLRGYIFADDWGWDYGWLFCRLPADPKANAASGVRSYCWSLSTSFFFVLWQGRRSCGDEERRFKSYHVGPRLIDLVDLMFWFVIHSVWSVLSLQCWGGLCIITPRHIVLRVINSILIYLSTLRGESISDFRDSWEAFHHFPRSIPNGIAFPTFWLLHPGGCIDDLRRLAPSGELERNTVWRRCFSWYVYLYLYVYMNFICYVHRHVHRYVQTYRTQHTCDVYNIAVERIDVYSVI